jgi:hypothetical protein
VKEVGLEDSYWILLAEDRAALENLVKLLVP